MSGAAKAALAGKSGLVARTGLVARAGLVLDHGAEGALLLADGLRSGVYRAFGRRLARFFRDREVRVAWFAGIAVTMGALLAVSAPLWLLALGPILLGVPHVVGDVRYLWTQPGYHKNKRVWLLVGPALLVGAVTADVGWGLAAALLALWALPASTQRRMAGAVVLVPLLVLSFVWRSEARLLFAHLHNLIALALWCIYRPRTRRFHWGVLAGVGAISLLILLGAADGASLSSSPDGRTMNFYGASLAPFASPVWAWRLVVVFAFAQSVHYAVWLRLMPEEARERPSPRPFRASYRQLKHEWGGLPLLGVLVTALVLAGWATFDLAGARDGYLRFAVFHGHLELAAGTLIVMGRTP